MKQIGNVILGVVLIALGVIFALNSTGVTNIDVFFDGWWTLFIIVPCVVGLFKDESKTGSIIGILIGVALLLSCQGVIMWETFGKLIVPAILVIIGVNIIFKDAINHDVSDKITQLNKSKNVEGGICATFSGQDVKLDGDKFEGTDVNAIFGGVKLDLTKAVIEKDIVINTYSIFGGIDILVPEDVKVKVKSTAIFGGVDNKHNSTNEKENVHTVYINALCLFGGLDVK